MIATVSKKLTEEAISALRNSQQSRNALQYKLDKSAVTIARWLKNNDIALTTAAALDIISEETGIEKENLLTN